MVPSSQTIERSVPILVFHKVDPRFEWGVTRITPKRFSLILEYLHKNQYRTVSLSDALNPECKLSEKSVVITFDDSYDSIYRYAFPLLVKYNFKATIFIITGFAGHLNEWDINLGGLKFAHLSWEQVRMMSKEGFEMGSHTVHHPDLTRVNDDLLRKEVTESKKRLEDETGQLIRFISFPFGRYNTKVLNMCREAGYQHGCGFWIRKKSDLPFVFERKAYYLFDGLRSLKTKLDHQWGRDFENLKLRIINFCSHGTSLVKPPRFERYDD